MNRNGNDFTVGTASAEELELISSSFSRKATEQDLRKLLRYLNGLTEHRFTGVYRFEPGWVVSVALWDRENPAMELGADVKMKESYCWLTGLGERAFIIEDAPSDARLQGHAAQHEVRSYIAIVLHDAAATPWGTLCHFDFEPRKVLPGTLERLDRFRPLVEEMIVRDARARWDPDAPSGPRAVRLDS